MDPLMIPACKFLLENTEPAHLWVVIRGKKAFKFESALAAWSFYERCKYREDEGTLDVVFMLITGPSVEDIEEGVNHNLFDTEWDNLAYKPQWVLLAHRVLKPPFLTRVRQFFY